MAIGKNDYDLNISPNRKITLQDIADAKGASKNKAAMWYHQVRILVTKGTLIRDKTIEKMISQSDPNTLKQLEHFFKDHQVHQDKKTTSDLAKIFDRSLGKIDNKAPQLSSIKDAAQLTHTLLDGEKYLKKQNPRALLEAALYEGKEPTGLKKDFLTYIRDNPEAGSSLKEIYKSFIKESIASASEKNDVSLQKLKEYPKEQPLKVYKEALQGHSGLFFEEKVHNLNIKEVQDLVAEGLELLPEKSLDTVVVEKVEAAQAKPLTQEAKLEILATLADVMVADKKYQAPGIFRVNGNPDVMGLLKDVLYKEAQPITEDRMREIISKASPIDLAGLIKILTKEIPDNKAEPAPLVFNQNLDKAALVKSLMDYRPAEAVAGNPKAKLALATLFNKVIEDPNTLFENADALGKAYPSFAGFIQDSKKIVEEHSTAS